jgi:hypothetical protein
VDDQSTEPAEPSDQLVDRRRTPRLRVTLDARCTRLGRTDQPDETTTVDVSQGGARIAAPTQLSIGDVVQLVVDTSHGIELTLQGLVVQLSHDGDDAGHHAHVAFDSLSAAAADLLTDLLAEQVERQAARDEPDQVS